MLVTLEVQTHNSVNHLLQVFICFSWWQLVLASDNPSNEIISSLVPVATFQQQPDHLLRQLDLSWFSVQWPPMKKGGPVLSGPWIMITNVPLRKTKKETEGKCDCIHVTQGETGKQQHVLSVYLSGIKKKIKVLIFKKTANLAEINWSAKVLFCLKGGLISIQSASSK